jgi:hypothetical protein
LWSDWTSRSLGNILTSRIRAWWRSIDTPNPWPGEVDIERLNGAQNDGPNQASEATSEPAPGADSSARRLQRSERHSGQT